MTNNAYHNTEWIQIVVVNAERLLSYKDIRNLHVFIKSARYGNPTSATLISMFMGPTWGPSGADRTQVDPMLAPWNFAIGQVRVWELRVTYLSICRCMVEVHGPWKPPQRPLLGSNRSRLLDTTLHTFPPLYWNNTYEWMNIYFTHLYIISRS